VSGLAYAVRSIPKGQAGIDVTLGVMVNIARKDCALPIVRDEAQRIVRGLSPYAAGERARRILAFVRDHVEFVPDPLHVEAITLPAEHLRRIRVEGITQGDCDDAATLISTLCRAVGVETRYVAASYIPGRGIHHVFAEARGLDGWITLDPFRSETFGRPELLRKVVPV
jgi:transglutaminase-like putative cysteine protease